MTSEREELLKKLTILYFLTLDLHLYLNTHPNDQKAIYKYNATVLEAEKMRYEYEKYYGSLCSYRSLTDSSTEWNWASDSWPWCECFNFELKCNKKEVSC